jgi:hypothetical protein
MRINPRPRRRIALSEVVGALLSLAITVIAGAAVFGYVNTQAGVTENRYAQSVGSAMGSIQEKFVAVDMSFGSSTSVTVWLYNNGQLTLQLTQIRLFDSTGKINLLYNYTISGGTKTNYVYDMLSTLSTKCKTAASPYESPTISSVSTLTGNTLAITLTIPPLQLGCPSFGQSFQSGTIYTVRVVGYYGNIVSYSQVR